MIVKAKDSSWIVPVGVAECRADAAMIGERPGLQPAVEICSSKLGRKSIHAVLAVNDNVEPVSRVPEFRKVRRRISPYSESLKQAWKRL